MKTQYKILLSAAAVLFALAVLHWSPPQPRLVVPIVNSTSTTTSAQPSVVKSPTSSRQSLLNKTNALPLPTIGGDHRLFAKLGVLERDEIMNEIATKDLSEIFQAMLDAGRVEHDLTKQLSIQTVFAGALREKTPSPDFLEKISRFIEDKSNTDFEREMLLVALGEAETTDTSNFLVGLAATLSDKKMSEVAASNIVKEGGPAHENLALAIEVLWRESSDEVIVKSMALTMAAVGASSSMELLLSAVLANNGTDDLRKRVALEALETADILNDHAVPPLAQRLSTQAPTSAASELAANTLARIQIPAAAQALVTWLQNANASAAPLVYVYVMQTQSEDIWQAALAPAVPFSSEANRAAIRAALVKLKATNTFVP